MSQQKLFDMEKLITSFAKSKDKREKQSNLQEKQKLITESTQQLNNAGSKVYDEVFNY